MELLLNLAWLLLALPAYWLWRGRARTRCFSALQLLLALGCMLVVLFPVISATDDLCAMRAELEESPSGKHNLRQNSHDRFSSSRWQTHPALPVNPDFAPGSHQAWLSLTPARSLHAAGHSTFLPSRAPPATLA